LTVLESGFEIRTPPFASIFYKILPVVDRDAG